MGVLKMSTKEKAGLADRLKKQPSADAGTMLERLESEELRHWIEVRNHSYADACRHGNETEQSLDKFITKCEKLSGWRLFIPYKFLIYTLAGPDVEEIAEDESDPGRKVILGPGRFSTAEIDLLLIFKYVLTKEVKRKIVKNEFFDNA